MNTTSRTFALFPPHAFRSKGGGGGTVMQAAPAPAPVTTPAAPPRPIPPVTERSIEVAAAGRDARVQAGKRKGMRSTILAGETGAYASASSTTPDGKKTLLG